MTRLPAALAQRVQQISEPRQPTWGAGHVRIAEKADGVVEAALKSCGDVLDALKVQQLEFSHKTLLHSDLCSFTVKRE